MNWITNLTFVEALASFCLLVFFGWVIWTSRRHKRFRAGVFVERNGEEDEKRPPDSG